MHFFQAKPDEVSSVKRKFMAEPGLHLYSGGATVLRPSDLYRFNKHPAFRELLQGCNIYIVARRPRITIEPSSLKIVDGMYLHGRFRIHGEQPDYFDGVHFAQDRPKVRAADGMPIQFVRAEVMNSAGLEVCVVDEFGVTGQIPVNALIADARHELGRHCDLEVLYVGQAFGQDGSRLAIDRTPVHSTLQRILAETMGETPHQEVLLLLFRYEHAKIMFSTAGDFSAEPSATWAEEFAMIQKVHKRLVSRRSRIALAEAALISHFKPKYNILLQDAFNVQKTKKLKFLKELLSLDFSGLLVEVNTSNFRSRLFSESARSKVLKDIFPADAVERLTSPTWPQEVGFSTQEVKQFVDDMTHVHIARYPLYSSAERESFLHSLRW
jgi:hypothetical protein